MTIVPGLAKTSRREVLLACGLPKSAHRWLCDVDGALEPSGLVVCRAFTRADAVRRVERGGLAAALLIGDRRRIDGLSLLRIIRSIDWKLPCWLVTDDTTRPALEAALSLSATGVMSQPVEVDELVMTLRKVLVDPIRGN